MATARASRGRSSKQQNEEAIKLIPVKGTPSLQRRLKIAAAEEGLTYAQLISRFLDSRDRNIARQRREQAHPLHRPANLEQL